MLSKLSAMPNQKYYFPRTAGHAPRRPARSSWRHNCYLLTCRPFRQAYWHRRRILLTRFLWYDGIISIFRHRLSPIVRRYSILKHGPGEAHAALFLAEADSMSCCHFGDRCREAEMGGFGALGSLSPASNNTRPSRHMASASLSVSCCDLPMTAVFIVNALLFHSY